VVAGGTPPAFVPAIQAAKVGGHTVREGIPYNDRERRIELLGPGGVVMLIWLASDPKVTDVQFRPRGSSVGSRTTMEDALREAGIA